MNYFKKKAQDSKKTILVTDSGLGGLSIFARIANHLAEKSPWSGVSMVYFNAWPEQYKGYNHLKTMDQKAGVFNNALMAMENFQPDMILIACNTLSVIYPFTPYSKSTGTRVSGIVDHGVQLIHEHLIKDPDSQVILFGTPTTIAEKSHERQLIKMDIDSSRITQQACTDLAGKIERNPFSKSVPQLINANVFKAVAKLHNSKGKVYAALCCTHFGYCRDLFKTALSKRLKQAAVMLDPNQRMADQVVKTQEKHSVSYDIDMHIVSRVFWEPERIEAYGRLLKNVSPLTVKALESYEWKPDLFEV
jgi:glutamate racemase